MSIGKVASACYLPQPPSLCLLSRPVSICICHLWGNDFVSRQQKTKLQLENVVMLGGGSQ